MNLARDWMTALSPDGWCARVQECRSAKSATAAGPEHFRFLRSQPGKAFCVLPSFLFVLIPPPFTFTLSLQVQAPATINANRCRICPMLSQCCTLQSAPSSWYCPVLYHNPRQPVALPLLKFHSPRSTVHIFSILSIPLSP